jgi:hypothetical protein
MDHQGVMTALLGASAGLAGLLLVFLGFIVTASGSLGDDVPEAVHTSMQRTALVLLGAFGVGLASVALTTAWLVGASGADAPLYDAAVALFALQLVALAGATGWTVRGLLWASGRHKQTRSSSPT